MLLNTAIAVFSAGRPPPWALALIGIVIGAAIYLRQACGSACLWGASFLPPHGLRTNRFSYSLCAQISGPTKTGARRMLHQREWSDSDLDIVRLRLTQRATFKTIASEFNCSTSAVSGAVNRNGMVGLSRHKAIAAKPKPTTATAQRTHKFLWARANPHTVQTRGVMRDLKCEVSPNAVTLAQCTAKNCRWPVSGGGQPFMMCGKTRLGKFTPYCAAHDERSRQSV
jgi:hypothetical protein